MTITSSQFNLDSFTSLMLKYFIGKLDLIIIPLLAICVDARLRLAFELLFSPILLLYFYNTDWLIINDFDYQFKIVSGTDCFLCLLPRKKECCQKPTPYILNTCD